MPSFKSLLALTVLAGSALADFPGSTFGITWNSTSPYGQSKGNIALVPTATGYIMALGGQAPEAPSNLTAFFSGMGYLTAACPSTVAGSGAILIPTTPKAPATKAYYIEWRKGSDLPEGSISLGLSLGPAPTYDEIITQPTVGKGLFKPIQVNGTYAIGWEDITFEQNKDVEVWLVKADPVSASC